MSHRSEADRFRVIALSAAGRTKTAVIRETGFSKDFVYRWYGRTDPKDAPHPGRRPKLTPPVIQTVKALMKGKKRRSTRKVAKVLDEKKHIVLSRESVRVAAHRAGLKAYHKQQKPLLTAEQRQRRLQFVNAYRATNWRHVLFADEKTFTLFGHPNRQNDVVWESSAENVPFNVSVKHPAKIQVWGAASYYGVLAPYLFNENLTAPLYVDILKARLPAASGLFPGGRWMYLHDGDRKHTSKLARDWLDTHIPSYIPKEHWPPNSPDLNIIEPLWTIVQDRVYSRDPRTMDGLKRIIREEWMAIDPELLHRLADSMPDRLAAVIAADGGPTKY
jgi:transposase